jgi:hypothetical protein
LLEQEDPPVEYRLSLPDPWSRKLLLSLCRRYEVDTFRYSGQRRTTVMIRASRRFVDETLWPEYEQLSAVLHQYLADVTDRVIRQAIHEDTSEAGERAPRGQLEAPRV